MGQGAAGVSLKTPFTLPSDALSSRAEVYGSASLRRGLGRGLFGPDQKARPAAHEAQISRRFFTTRMTQVSSESRGASSLAAVPRRLQRGRPARAGGRTGRRAVRLRTVAKSTQPKYLTAWAVVPSVLWNRGMAVLGRGIGG